MCREARGIRSGSVSLDLPPTHWYRGTCKKNVTMSERDATFDATLQIARDKCDLKTLEYNKEYRTFVTRYLKMSPIVTKSSIRI
jgi:hypothetical protein